MESHVHRKSSEIAVIKLQPSNVFPSHCSKLEAYLSSMIFCSHHPSGITVKIVRIESGTNSRSCYQHDVCGSLVEEDVVLWLRKIQMMKQHWTSPHVTDGIEQCHVGFLPHHFVPHAPSFDGVLGQVTEVYSPTSSKSVSNICWSLQRIGITPAGANSMSD
jgi:hypothetical protein